MVKLTDINTIIFSTFIFPLQVVICQIHQQDNDLAHVCLESLPNFLINSLQDSKILLNSATHLTHRFHKPMLWKI
jgi:hypothetical protein